MELDKHLKRRNIKRYEFAAMIGVQPSTITHLISGKYWMTRRLARKIWKATGGKVTPNDFVWLDEEE